MLTASLGTTLFLPFSAMADVPPAVQATCDAIKDNSLKGRLTTQILNWATSWFGSQPVNDTVNPTPDAQGLYTCTVSDPGTTLDMFIDKNGSATVRSSDGAFGVLNGQPQIISGSTPGQSVSANKIPNNSCAGLTGFLGNFTDCLGRSIAVIIGTALVTLTAWLLGLAGLLFNVLVDHTVLNFGQWFYSDASTGLGVKAAIDSAWSAFRDIANILIIGMFVFIAISIILDFSISGQNPRKLVARVLMIAVLINFSLLFTKLIIDGSNFTASQLYSATGLQQTNGTPQTISDFNSFSQTGIAGSFIQFTGVKSISDAATSLSNAAFGSANQNFANANGWLALLHGVVAATFLLVAAVVLLYGCFLLASRALLLVFLMFTASVAFASYLVPRWETSSYGWQKWWSSLLRSAVFAPLLMLFLWISLSVGKAVQAKTSTGSLGNLLTNPDSQLNLDSVFAYIVVIGLLFISLRLSSVFASRIAGFSIAAMVPGAALGLAGGLTGMLGRNFVGWPASKGLTALRKRAHGYYDEQAGKWVPGKGDNFATRLAARGLARVQKTPFNPLKAGPVATAAQAVGVPSMFTGKKALASEGFQAVMTRRAKRADEVARAVGPSGEQQAAERLEAGRVALQRHRELLAATQTLIRIQQDAKSVLTQDIQQRAKQAQPERPQAEAELQRTREAHPQYAEYTAAKNNLDTADREFEQRRDGRRAIDDALRSQLSTITNPTRRADVERQLETSSREQRDSELRHQQERIERARDVTRIEQVVAQDPEVARRQQVLDNLDQTAREISNRMIANDPQIAALNTQIADLEARERELRRDEGVVAKRAEQAVRDLQGKQDIKLRNALLWDPRAAPFVPGQMQQHARQQALGDIRAALREDQPAKRPTSTPKTPGGGTTPT